MYSDKFKDFLKAIDLQNFPRKYLKVFSTDFIFRKQKILLTTRIIIC